MRPDDNLHVLAFEPLTPPRVLRERYPITEAAAQTVYETRETIKRIMKREDRRLLAVVGPCSIHDIDAALDYARRLLRLAIEMRDRIVIVMRAYFEKPRTTVGWRGLINDPHLDGSFDMNEGLRRARELLLHINTMGLPTATEMLDPISPQYITDLISMTAIGARTVESQTHRALASGLSMPVGYKNSTDGNVQVAINAFLAARQAHSFLGIDQEGRSCVVRTTGNPDGMIILRGSSAGPNYDAETVTRTEQAMRAAGLSPAIMIDCSHANAGGDYRRQPQVWRDVLRDHIASSNAVIGMMVESNLYEGKQPIAADLTQLRYGVSVTDACVGWETTERMLIEAYEAVGR